MLDQERGRFEAERHALDERAAAHEKRWLQQIDRAREALKTAEARATRAASDQPQRLEALQRDLQSVAAERSRLSERATAQDRELVRLRSEHEAAMTMASDLRAQLGRREAEAATQLQEQLAMALQQLAEKERSMAPSGDLERDRARRESKDRSPRALGGRTSHGDGE